MLALTHRVMRAVARGVNFAAFAAILAIAIPTINGAAAQTLDEALVQAYLDNPTLRAQRAALRATDERVPQALSGYRPTMDLSGNVGRTHSPQYLRRPSPA